MSQMKKLKPESVSNKDWYFENIFEFVHMSIFKKNKEFVEKQTKFQNMKIMDLGCIGRTLILDDLIQSAEKDEALYHELLVHPSLLLHPNPEKVFIGGGGEGATAREVLKHKSVTKCVMVDIDGDCVEFCKKYLPKHNKGVYENPKMELIIDDAKKYILDCEENYFDVMVMDLSDPAEGGPCYQLYTREFYELCSSRLKKNGILVTQATCCDKFNAELVFAPILNTIKQVFTKVTPYGIFIPSFVGEWGFVLAEKDPKINVKELGVDELIGKRINGGEKVLEIYDEETHKKCFSLAKDIRNVIKKEKRILKKDNYIFFS